MNANVVFLTYSKDTIIGCSALPTENGLGSDYWKPLERTFDYLNFYEVNTAQFAKSIKVIINSTYGTGDFLT